MNLVGIVYKTQQKYIFSTVIKTIKEYIKQALCIMGNNIRIFYSWFDTFIWNGVRV